MGNRATHRPKPLGTATVSAAWWWNDRAKAWDVRLEHRNGTVVMRRVDTSSDISFAELWLMVDAIQAEMMSWLA